MEDLIMSMPDLSVVRGGIRWPVILEANDPPVSLSGGRGLMLRLHTLHGHRGKLRLDRVNVYFPAGKLSALIAGVLVTQTPGEVFRSFAMNHTEEAPRDGIAATIGIMATGQRARPKGGLTYSQALYKIELFRPRSV